MSIQDFVKQVREPKDSDLVELQKILDSLKLDEEEQIYIITTESND
jgi:hypothetical protein